MINIVPSRAYINAIAQSAFKGNHIYEFHVFVIGPTLYILRVLSLSGRYFYNMYIVKIV